MSKSTSRKGTVQLGWRLRADVVRAFREWCVSERKDPTLELEYLIEQALASHQKKGPQKTAPVPQG